MYVQSLNETLYAADYVVSNSSYAININELLAASLATWALFYRFALPAISFSVSYESIEGNVVGYIQCWRLDLCKITIDPSYYQYEAVMDHEVGHALYFNLASSTVDARVLPGRPPSSAIFSDNHWWGLSNDVMAATIGHDPEFSDVTILALAAHLADTRLCGSDQSLCTNNEVCHAAIENAPGLCAYLSPDVDYADNESHDNMYFFLIVGVSVFLICAIMVAWRWGDCEQVNKKKPGI